MHKKRMLILGTTLLLLFGAVTAVFGADRIGQPYVNFGYDNPTLHELITIVGFVHNPHVNQLSEKTVATIETTDSAFKPIWSHIPITRYYIDTTAQFTKRVAFVSMPSGPAEMLGKITNSIVNMIFFVTIWITRFSIELLLMAFNSKILAAIGQDAVNAAKEIWSGGTASTGIKNTVLLIALAFGSFYFIFRLAQSRYMDIIKASMMTILILGLSMAYFANTDKILTTATGTVDSISNAAFSVMPVDDDLPIKDPRQRGLVSFASQIWDSLIVTPWAFSEFGTDDIDKLKITAAEAEELEKVIKPLAGHNIDFRNLRVDQVILALPAGSSYRQDAVNIFQDEDVDHGGHNLTPVTLCSGNALDAGPIVGIAFVGSIVFTVFACVIGIILCIADITVIFGLIMAPFIAVLALIPETGWNTAVRWLKIVLSALFTKVFYGIYASVVFLVIGTVLKL
jgi:hypothetical protein